MAKMGLHQIKKYKLAEKGAKEVLKPGDRICVKCCGGVKKTYIFERWAGQWVVPKGAADDIHPVNIYRVNGAAANFS